ncbi:MAG: hypothetical protein IT534_09695 [Bauldia sp.]|nr:hypothetical protein [Bauldia sp.]
MNWWKLSGLWLVAVLATLPRTAAADETDAQARGIYEAVAPRSCSGDVVPIPEVFNLTYPALAEPGQSTTVRIYRFSCRSSEQLTEHVYLSSTAAEGLQLMTFAEPTYSIGCGNGPTNMTIECTTRVDGFGSLIALPNSSFDPATATITACRFWLPPPCVAVARVWVLRDARFVLTEAEGLAPSAAYTKRHAAGHRGVKP